MRSFISLFFSLLLIPSALAATIVSENTNRMKANETRILFPITITAEYGDEITAQKGINLLIDTNVRILWQAVPTLQASGLAVLNGRVAATVKPEYKNDYAVLHIPVMDDFQGNEDVTFTGISLRGYNRVFSKRFIGMDLNGDLQADATDINAYFIEDVTATDQSGPYPATDFKYTVSDDRSAVTLTWRHPPDYDLIGMDIEKIVTRNGQTTPPSTLVSLTAENTVVDKEIQAGDQITYTLYGRDLRNIGDKVSLVVAIEPPVDAPLPAVQVPPPPARQVGPDAVLSTDKEMKELQKLHGYYKVRYQIKCRAQDSACLWAKIDLAYTQKKIGRSDVPVSLTAHDLELMKQRISYPAGRYLKNCAQASAPAAYCDSLNEALNRARYFLNQSLP